MYGSGAAGLKDGAGIEAEFRSPQGLAWHDGTLLVADTDNHAIRKVCLFVWIHFLSLVIFSTWQIDLQTHQVTTIAGTGRQGNDKEGGAVGCEQPLSSPWDVAVNDGVLYIAMAGTHQIWVHFLEDKDWIKKRYTAPSGVAATQ